MAQALGVKVGRDLRGELRDRCGRWRVFCGALYAPTMTLIPTMGASFIVESFVTVVVGGANVLLGTAPAGILLAADAHDAECLGRVRSSVRSGCWSR